MSSRDKYTDDITNRIKYSDPVDPFEIIDSPWGQIEAWRASTMATGTMGAYDTYVAHTRTELQQMRDDSVGILADAAEKIATLQKLQDGVLKLMHRLDAQVTRLEAQHRRDAELEAERQRFAEPIALPPGEEPSREDGRDLPGMGECEPDLPSNPGSDEAAGPPPAGDLHSLPAKEDPMEAIEDQGVLPAELLKDTPPETGNYPSMEEPERKQVPQPTAISLW
jgi:hypothetical protein